MSLLEEMLEERVREIEAVTGLSVVTVEDEAIADGGYFAMMLTPDNKPVSVVELTDDTMGDLDRLIGSFLSNGHTRSCRSSVN